MTSTNNVITFTSKCNNNVIHSNCNYKVITKHHKSNNNIITFNKYYNVITLLLFCIYNVITFTFTPAHALTLQSEVIQGSYIYGQADKGEKIFFNQTEIKQDNNGLFIFALPQDTDKTLILQVEQNGKTTDLSFPITSRKWKEEVVNGLPSAKVHPNTQNQERIWLENVLIGEARKTTSYDTLPVCFTRPVKKYRLSSHFGSRRVLNGQKTAGHSGSDYAAAIGTPVYAPADGTVTLTHEDMFLTGKTVIIDHGFGIFSTYSHLNEIAVNSGQSVKQGDNIGTIGVTGRVTGPHLHFMMNWFKTKVDPEYIFKTFPCPTENVSQPTDKKIEK